MKRLFALIGLALITTISFGQNNHVMEQRLSVITLGVSDLSQSIDFYENKLGWKPSEMSSENIVFFEHDGIILSLYGRKELAEDATVDPGGNGFKGFTLAYFTRSQIEVDELIENLRGVH